MVFLMIELNLYSQSNPYYKMKNILFYTKLSFLVLMSQQAQATWTIDSLAGNRAFMASITIGTKAVFSNGYNWDIFDESTHLWSSGNFFMARKETYPISNGDKAYFAGGWKGSFADPVDVNSIEVYNNVTGLWSSLTLSQGRRVGAAAAIGNKVIFAGGYRVLAYSNRVEFFDVLTDVRTTALLSQARTNIAVGVSGDKVVFAGGQKGQPTMGVINSSDRVDIYDNALNTWSTATLSSKRQHIGVAVIGSKIIFAGGINMASGISTNNVDVYDAITNTWTVHHLSQKKYAMTSAVVGTKAYFFGGIVNSAGSLSSRVEIYDSSTGLWTVKYLTGPHHAGVVTVTDERVMYSGGIETWGNIGTSKIEVLNIATGTWSVEQLSEPRLYLSSASFQHTAIVVGGVQVWSSYPLYTIPSKRVDIWNDNIIIRMIPEIKQDKHTVTIYPNPVVGLLHVQVSGSENEDYVYQLFTVSGQKVTEELHSNELINDMNIADLPKGVYILNVRFESGINSAMRVIKE